jgi:lysophospholipase L1-like esterase
VVLALVSLLAAAGLSELILRVSGYSYSPVQIGEGVKDDWRDRHIQDRFMVYDPVLIWRPQGGGFSPFNPQGFRGAPIDPAKPPGTVRVFALGDSNTFGWNVDDGVNWPTQLQKLLVERTHPTTEVLNAGVWGYTSYQGAKRFQELLPFNPDIVLVSFGANDAHMVRVPDAIYVAKHDRIQQLTRATKNMRLAQLAVAAWDRVDGARSATELRPRVTVDEYRANLQDMIRRARERGVQVVLLTRPFTGGYEDPNSWKARAPEYNAVLNEIGRTEKAQVIDVYAAFEDHPELFDDESHFGSKGHVVMAQLIYDELVKEILERARAAPRR